MPFTRMNVIAMFVRIVARFDEWNQLRLMVLLEICRIKTKREEIDINYSATG